MLVVGVLQPPFREINFKKLVNMFIGLILWFGAVLLVHD